jgi:hypothetical protein
MNSTPCFLTCLYWTSIYSSGDYGLIDIEFSICCIPYIAAHACMFGRAAAFCAWYMLEPVLVDMALHCCDPLLALDSVQVHSVMDVVHGRVF